MELNSHIIGIQGVILNIQQKIGELSKINYKGGNEEKIEHITKELNTYLINKGHLVDGKVNEASTKELNEIVYFLALNTVFKNKVDFTSNYPQLLKIIPHITKCVLANICFELNLIPQYCNLIETLPLELTQELLDQIYECLKKAKPDDGLPKTFCVLKAVINKLYQVEFSNKTEDTIEDVVVVSNMMLQNLTGLFTDQVQQMRISQIYRHMGFTFLHLLDLLLYINENVIAVKKILEFLIGITGTLVKAITLDVYCEWAEVDHDDQPLQMVVATKAYNIIEKYQKHTFASELVGLLGNIARKPKTINEQIQEADINTIIKRINQKDENQRAWFKALLNTRIFDKPEVIKCVNQWWNLCDDSDVDRLLSVPLPRNVEDRQLICKCAGNIEVDMLKRVLTIHFHRQKFTWKEDIQSELTVMFNQHQGTFNDQDLKNILLMILRNAKMFFDHFYAVAFNGNVQVFSQIFELTNDIMKIDNIGLSCISDMLEENKLSTQNVTKYINFLNALIDNQCYSWDYIVSNILLRMTNRFKIGGSLPELGCSLFLFKHFSHLSCEFMRELEIFEYIMICASENRCKSFLEFDSLREEITQHCVEYMLQKCQQFKWRNIKQEGSNIGYQLSDPWSNYYKSLMFNNEKTVFIDFLIPNFDLAQYADGKADENFTSLLKILPRCITSEWEIVLEEVQEKCGHSTMTNALTDILILLCDITAQSTSGSSNLITALKFCLQMFGKFSLLKSKSKEEQLVAANNLCRLLKHLPDSVKHTEGLLLINTLPEDTFKGLAQNKDFIARVVLINDKQICKVLAEKMLAK